MKTLHSIRLLLGTVLILGGACMQDALAVPASGRAMGSISVSYADLNLATSKDAAKLYRRISSAADLVCGPMDSRSLRVVSQYRTCRRQAIDSAVRAVDAQALTALHRERVARTRTG